MTVWSQTILTFISAVIASSGFWIFMQKVCDKKDVKTQMIIGLGHDRIVALCMFYLARGDWITKDEYENLVDYLYEPYRKMGGNGTAKRLVEEVKKLRVVPSSLETPKEVLT